MATYEKLYEAFGELLYVMAMADGLIQEEEIAALERVLKDHEALADIRWSFDYERKKERSPEDVYAKVLDFCKHHGPDPEYQTMVQAMQAIAKASAGVDADEQAVMDTFSATLIQKFQRDLEVI